MPAAIASPDRPCADFAPNGDRILKKPQGHDAASGLTLDNLEDKIASLRDASSHTRNSKRLRDAARLKKQREDRAKLKLAAAARPADE